MKKKIIAIAFLLLLVVTVTLFQASHSVIEEEPIIEKNNRIYIDRLSNVEEIGSAQELSKPELDVLEIKNINASLKNPGDFISYNFNLINEGNNNITIKDVEKNIECTSNTLEEEIVNKICQNISIDLIYKNSSLDELDEGDIIFANSTNGIVLNLIYNNSATSPEEIDLEIKNASIKIIY